MGSDVQGGEVTVEQTLLPLCPFPPLPWWGAVLSGDVMLDGLEHYPKRTFRNRYHIMQSTGVVCQTVPVERRGGRPRPQDDTMRITGEPDRKAWQAVKTAYGRTPYFEEMSGELEDLFRNGPASLGGWNRATMAWAGSWLGIAVPLDATPDQRRVSPPCSMMNLMASAVVHMRPRWPHVWQDRQPHIPYENLGILDLLLHLGPEAAGLITPTSPNAPQHPG
ncbi:MAG: WbqC family protein [Flavobacteriales bacterium]|nr:WbqC family protein [Flavobacteriales bacterium]